MIRDVHREDRGIYQCVVDGLHDEVAMQTFQLDLGGKTNFKNLVWIYKLWTCQSIEKNWKAFSTRHVHFFILTVNWFLNIVPLDQMRKM